MGRDDEDGSSLVVYGTALENSDELSARKRAKALDRGTLRQQQPVWKQDARDSEGRRRFHGAFTGGFSAGYFNTVGSKEGWEPKTFKSSRSNRAGLQQHSAYDYMDEDERKDLDSRNIGTSNEFDTFGFTAAEFARREAMQENKTRTERPSIIPGPIPDEIVVPANESIGVKLLRKMGWRQGRAIGPKHVAASSDARREGRKAMMALASGTGATADANATVLDDEEIVEKEVPSTTPNFVKKPKDNVHGLGFDPYKSAPEFREAKRSRLDDEKKDRPFSKPSMFRPGAGTMSQGFGIGALEEMGEEDEDVYAIGPRPEKLVLEEDDLEQPEKMSKRVTMPEFPEISYGKHGVPGFKPATASEKAFQAEWFHPPVVPPDYVPVHKFVTTFDPSQSDVNAPPEAQPPDDKVLVKLIDGLSILVAKSGVQFEALSREKNKENPQFQFLFGGPGSDYYTRRLWEERSKRGVQTQLKKDVTKLSASERGQVLGETPLQARPSIPEEDRARLQATLNNTFMKPVSEPSASSSKPFENDPAKQARYDQFLKDKYQGGLRKMNRGAQQLSEVQRAQEILEFETMAHAASGMAPPSSSTLSKLGVSNDNKFTSGGHEQSGLFVKSSDKKETLKTLPQQAAPVSHQRPPPSTQYPKRSESSWRPLPLLCKRFDVLDPYCGQSALAKPKSRIDSLTLATPSESLWSSKLSVVLPEPPNASHDDKKEEAPGDGDLATQPEEKEPIEQLAEKPVDLYKAIFSDDEDMEESQSIAEPQKNLEAANAALNRLVADDFLNSLGKELGLAVPPPVTTVREPEAPKDIPKGHIKFVKPKERLAEDASSKPESTSKELTSVSDAADPVPSAATSRPDEIPTDFHKGYIKFVKPSNGSKEAVDLDNKSRRDGEEDYRRKRHRHHSRDKSKKRKEHSRSTDESSPENRERKRKSKSRDESPEDRKRKSKTREESPEDRKRKARTRGESPEDRRKHKRSNRDESPEDRRRSRADESSEERRKLKKRERKQKERRHKSRKRRHSLSPSSPSTSSSS